MTTFPESRRSTRVPLQVAIAVEDQADSVTCEGETTVVNLHGALLVTTLGLSVGMRILVHIYLTDKHSKARVAYVDPTNPLQCSRSLTSVQPFLSPNESARDFGGEFSQIRPLKNGVRSPSAIRRKVQKRVHQLLNHFSRQG